ncbi:marine proteobacterial sortase target protein, partial [Rhizobium ruizarguesonis]
MRHAVERPFADLESISEVIRIYPLKSEASSNSAIATNKPQQMPRHAAIRSRARRDRSRIIRHPKLVIEGMPMFLEDEFAIGRIRARRISVSVLVAVTAFAACIAAM